MRGLLKLIDSTIAEDFVAGHPELTSAECFLVSQIGQPIDQPQLVDVRSSLRRPGAGPSVSEVEWMVTHHLAGLRTPC